MSATLEDQTRTCVECEREFVWSAGEQEFFREKGFTDAPKRCKDCRQAKRARRDDRREDGNR